MAKPRVTATADELRRAAREIFVAAGTSEEDARQMADAFVWANLRGIDSHGIAKVPRYLELFEKGEANPRPTVRVERTRPAAITVDADQAPGPVALSGAMAAAIELAGETGVAIASVRGTVHTGAIGYYTTLAAQAGMVGIGIVAGVPNMGYEGARGPAVATSPLSIALPAGEEPAFLLDMATAAIALGKIAQYRLRGEELPAGVAVSAEGEPTTDPNVAKIPQPVGGAKGSGMSLAFELLASGLAGNPIVSEYHGDSPDGKRHRQNALLIAIDVSAFLPLERYREIVDETLRTIGALPPAGEGPVLYPGARGAATLAKREHDGVAVPEPLWEQIAAAAERLGVDPPVGKKVG